jgi:pimeloyl-ACP methyl ester carboxylesterase
LADPLFEPGWTSRFVDANGLRFHLVEAGPVDGPALILLHGFPEFWWAWRKQITPLARAGFRVIAPDMGGYNLSEAPDGLNAYGLDVLANDVPAIADALGVDRFHLAAHDWGGVVAWWTAVRHPNRIERLVIMDAPHPDIWPKQMLRHPTQAIRSTYAMFFQLPWAPEALLRGFGFAGARALMEETARPDAFEPGAMNRYVEAWSKPGRLTAMLNYYRALLRRKRASSPSRIAVETLVLWGENDTALEHHVAQASVAQCHRGQLRVIPGTTHWLHLEEPERIVAELTGFSNP